MTERAAYDHKKIEEKWQAEWENSGIYRAREAAEAGDKKKFYCLVEFPFPSGDGLHVGHIRSYTALDILARKRRMEGQNLLYPMGWDAFGLPTENYAIKTGKNPALVTKENTDNFRRQLQSLGFSFDWSREINTTNPEYYKWTQWIFLQFYKHGLAYKAKTLINWCPRDKIGLANEEVVAGHCERCGAAVEQREKEQWMLAITKYADRLINDLDLVDYPEPVKIQQRNWIGRSEGALIRFDDIQVFTTRPETIFGATFIAVPGKQDKFTGKYVTNPATGEKIPVWEAEYVMASVGTGALMGVPAHDKRDWDFAKKYDLQIRHVVARDKFSVAGFGNWNFQEKARQIFNRSIQPEADCYLGEGVLVNSGEFDGLESEEAREKITEKFGEKKTTYKLRDWVFSRQRYWGEPIPMIFCEKCGWQPVPERDLPVVLPELEQFQPGADGESPLASVTDWVNVKCPKCGGEARRETDTMPNWAGSSWYYLRYCDPRNTQEFADAEKLNYWLPSGVDWYNGGMEHTTLHLLYSRFWHKFLFDRKLLPSPEPYRKRTSHGLILAPDGEKMSKSRGNVVNPDRIIELYGADTLRLYEMFMGPFEQAVAWNTESIIGPRRFLERVWRLGEKIGKASAGEVEINLSDPVRKITADIEALKLNTAVSGLMILLNNFEKNGANREAYEIFLRLLAPFAPHIAEELWQKLGHGTSIHRASWPEAGTLAAKTTTRGRLVMIQVDGIIRDRVVLDSAGEIGEEVVKNLALQSQKVQKWLGGKTVKKLVYVPGRLLNFVIYDNIKNHEE